MSDPWKAWRKMVECVTVVGRMPVRFELRDMYWESLELDRRINRRASSYRNQPVLHLLLEVPERDTSEPTTVVFSQELPWDAYQWDGKTMLDYLRSRLVDAYLHELDESIRIGDARPYDPHKPKLTCADALKRLLQGESVDERPVDAPAKVSYDDADIKRMEQTVRDARRDR